MSTSNLSPLRHARRAALILGLIYALRLVSISVMVQMPAMAILYLGLTIMIPIFAYRATRAYRASLPGEIPFSFSLGWLYGVVLFACTALLMLLPYYIFHSSVLPELLTQIEQSLQTLKAEDPELSVALTRLLGGADPITALRSSLAGASMTMKLWSEFSSITFAGSIISAVVALILRRK